MCSFHYLGECPWGDKCDWNHDTFYCGMLGEYRRALGQGAGKKIVVAGIDIEDLVQEWVHKINVVFKERSGKGVHDV